MTRSPGALMAELDRETVLMSIDHGNYYTLSATSRAIWQLIEQPIPVRDLCAQLTLAYDADPVAVQADTLAFLTYLHGLNLADIVDLSNL